LTDIWVDPIILIDIWVDIADTSNIADICGRYW